MHSTSDIDLGDQGFLRESSGRRFSTFPTFDGLDTIIEDLTMSTMTVNSKAYAVQLFIHNGSSYSYSSNHLAIFCRLLPQPCLLRRESALLVVFKFRIQPIPDRPNMFTVRYMTDEEMEATKQKTNLLIRYCDSFNQLPNPFNTQVRANSSFNGKVEGHNIWMEEYIPQFSKFWGLQGQHVHRMVGTSSPVLSIFQRYIFIESGFTHTVIDLQGGYFDRQYVLSDIEFTDTFPMEGLLDVFVSSIPYASLICPLPQSFQKQIMQ